ncbi:MAG: tRNA preQ1(34) S-adenosylmethionine ribosyltransferase-isomerase QueA [Pseudomonadales bacterium]|nr:tRNA preQ1(34) S-adenosylmethionine ribosyltransferase-isomerase QueA [Pseudomonadales bacterium]
MKLSDFDYQLPEELIARYPASRRSDSRLLCLDRRSGDLQHRVFRELPELLDANDLLVFNNTRVIPARLFARKESGGKVEVMIERIQQDNRLLAQLKCSRSPATGSRLIFAAEGGADGADGTGVSAEVLARQDSFFQLQFDQELDLMAFLKSAGHMPLPPYIKRDDEQLDSERYQTVYASNEGAVAAPTAGLHFDETLFAALDELGVSQAYLTLHVGAGTFQPVRVENIEQHRMHREWIEVDESVCEAVRQCRARGGRVIAVGTTSVRSLETAASSGEIQPFTGETDIFIYPGYEFKAVDAMVTNFHLPESTLMMLVSAFSSKKMLLDAYHEAIREKYRFFSYGDAMFLY